MLRGSRGLGELSWQCGLRFANRFEFGKPGSPCLGLTLGRHDALAELFSHQRQPQHVALEQLAKAGKHGRFLLVLEYVELADDVVALAAGADEFAEGGPTVACDALLVDGLGQHPRYKERVVPDVLSHGALSIEGRSFAENRIRGRDHLGEFAKRVALTAAVDKQAVFFRKTAQDARHVAGDLGIVETELALEDGSDFVMEKGLERVSLRRHTRLLGRIQTDASERPECNVRSAGRKPGHAELAFYCGLDYLSFASGEVIFITFP